MTLGREYYSQASLQASGENLRADKSEQIAIAVQIMASIMGTEKALVRMQFVSGTHAIASALFACLRPGDQLIAVAGR